MGHSIEYQTRVAESGQGRAIRDRVLEALDLRPGQVALDVGCGPGTNLAELAAAVAPSGTVIGVDLDPAMVDEAGRRLAGHDSVEVRLGDAHDLPVDNDSVDRARADRVLQHLESPAQAIAELRRVSRPGGVVTLSEPDWASLVIDADDLETSAEFARYTCAQVVRNASVGRQLARVAAAAGFMIREVQVLTPLFQVFDQADRVLGLTRNSARAVADGYLEAGRAERWLAELRQPPFLATTMLFTVVAEAPDVTG